MQQPNNSLVSSDQDLAKPLRPIDRTLNSNSKVSECAGQVAAMLTPPNSLLPRPCQVSATSPNVHHRQYEPAGSDVSRSYCREYEPPDSSTPNSSSTFSAAAQTPWGKAQCGAGVWKPRAKI
ncbi:hypothetical protein J1614_000381 [Plenodomus biglobosus]|nr:hypothetical protein J1614_000381 [Plenodomus biglobosus]